MRKRLIFMVLAGALWSLSVSGLAQTPACTPDLYGKMLCPPPNGGMMTDINGNTVCGPGACGRNNRGLVRCSSMPGGLIVIDSSGNVLCVGGCVDGEKSACMRPVP